MFWSSIKKFLGLADLNCLWIIHAVTHRWKWVLAASPLLLLIHRFESMVCLYQKLCVPQLRVVDISGVVGAVFGNNRLVKHGILKVLVVD